LLHAVWLTGDLETRATQYAIEQLVPGHFAEVRGRKEELLDKTLKAAKERLAREVIYWDHRAEELRLQEQAGKTPRLNSAGARGRADDLEARLKLPVEELEQERRLSPLPPVVVGGELVVPGGLLARLLGKQPAHPDAVARKTRRVELAAMESVMAAERGLGYERLDVSAAKIGYDESCIPTAQSVLAALQPRRRCRSAARFAVFARGW
jgi:hypothetical protein